MSLTFSALKSWGIKGNLLNFFKRFRIFCDVTNINLKTLTDVDVFENLKCVHLKERIKKYNFSKGTKSCVSSTQVGLIEFTHYFLQPMANVQKYWIFQMFSDFLCNHQQQTQKFSWCWYFWKLKMSSFERAY